MSQSLIQGKRFFCREWVFSKILHCLESLERRGEDDNNAGRSGLGILIVSGPGGGKTAVSSEMVSPTVPAGKQLTLRKRLLAHHFCMSHDLNTLSVAEFILHLVQQLSSSPLLTGYTEKVEAADADGITLQAITEDPDAAFKRYIAFPLLEIESPKHSSFLLVDSIDETSITYHTSNLSTSSSSNHKSSSSSGGPGTCSNTIGELLGNNCHLLPPWLVLICTARKQSKAVSRLFSGFRKISLDDLRKPQVRNI
jgi:hypothetical protein